MITLRENQQKLHYALYGVEIPIKTADGLDTGRKEIAYTVPKEFFASISMGGGRAEYEEFGIDTSAYDATIVLPKGVLPIDESSLIWHKSDIRWKDEENGVPDEKSADYRVTKVTESLNFTKYILKRVIK